MKATAAYFYQSLVLILCFGLLACGGSSGGGSESGGRSDGSGTWTWYGGSESYNYIGVYPESLDAMCIQNNTCIPPSRNAAMSWIDNNSNLWLFGGYMTAIPNSSQSSNINDLWIYNTQSKYWIFESGPTFDSSFYNPLGIQGIWPTLPSTIGYPSARQSGATWTDSTGKFWLFGGLGNDYTGSTNGYLSDLWTYDVNLKVWTLVGGQNSINNSGIYGSLGVADANNWPGGRYETITWIDATGEILWLFGGYAVDSTGAQGYLNDLWSYNISTGQWTWQAGESNVPINGNGGIYTAIGESGYPGARGAGVAWAESFYTGEYLIWLFGGNSGQTSTSNSFNDLWLMHESGTWIWLGGESITNNTPGNYGTRGIPNKSNWPGSRNALNWSDESGRFWIFAGDGIDKNGTFGNLNDWWLYYPESNTWVWIGGESIVNSLGVYNGIGKQGIPGSRYFASNWYDAKTNQIWLFGGLNFGESSGQSVSNFLGDLWMWKPPK